MKNSRWIHNQNTKIEEVSRKFNLENAKVYSTPMKTGYLRINNEEKPMSNNTKYRQAIVASTYNYRYQTRYIRRSEYLEPKN